MKIRTIFLLSAGLLATGTALAQSKSEMQASIATLTAQNDSLSKQVNTLQEANKKYSMLIDTLSAMTGVAVNDLDTVKTVLELRAAARTADADSLTQERSKAAVLQLTVDSLAQQVARMRADSLSMADQLVTAVSAQSPDAKAAPAMSKTDQMMKLNGMLEQGLISKDEFLKLKAEMMAK